MNYPVMKPPFEFKDFESMNKKEAKQYFDWYLSQIPERIEILKKVSDNQIALDYSKESLIPLFSWFLSTVTIYRLSKEEIKADLEDLSQYPDYVYEDEKDRLLSNPVDLKEEDYALAKDIAIYYGETLIKNYPQVHWTYLTKPKSYVFLNEPILKISNGEGFLERNPEEMLRVLIQLIKRDEIEDKTLYEMFLMDVSDILGEDEEEEE